MSRVVTFDFESVPADALRADLFRTLPRRPCVLRVFDRNNNLILLEKTHNLVSRLERFYSESPQTGAIDLREISDRIEFSLTDSPFESLYLLYLERRRWFPSSYRRMKTFPLFHLIEIDMRARFPRIETTRNMKGLCRYFGPYRSRVEVEQAKAAAERVFRIRPCDYDIRGDDPYPDCLYFQMETCSRPCNGDISAGSYGQDVTSAIDLMRGKDEASLDPLVRRIRALAEETRFEEAEGLRVLLDRARRDQADTQRRIFEVDAFDFVVLMNARSKQNRKFALIRAGRILRLEEHAIDTLESTLARSLNDAVTQPLPESEPATYRYDEFCLSASFLLKPLKSSAFFPIGDPVESAAAIAEHVAAGADGKTRAGGVPTQPNEAPASAPRVSQTEG